MKRKYFSESHRKSSEAAQKAVEEMSRHPLSAEQAMEQCLRHRRGDSVLLQRSDEKEAIRKIWLETATFLFCK